MSGGDTSVKDLLSENADANSIDSGLSDRSTKRAISSVLIWIKRLLLVVALVVLLLILLAPGVLALNNPVTTSTSILLPPSGSHWFGTDQLGRDVYSRTVYGARPVLIASFLGVLLATVGGVVVGLIGGFGPRLVRGLVMRLVDVMLAMPVLLIALILIATVGSGLSSIVVAVGIAFTPGFARVVDSSVRKFRAMEYVQASAVFGSSGLRTSVRHILPNLASEVIVLASSGIGWAVLTATTLSFLGLGVRLPAPDWGSDLSAGATYLSTAWWLSTFPGAAITVTILVANFLGDYITGFIDPRSGASLAKTLRGIVGIRNLRSSAGEVSNPTS